MGSNHQRRPRLALAITTAVALTASSCGLIGGDDDTAAVDTSAAPTTTIVSDGSAGEGSAGDGSAGEGDDASIDESSDTTAEAAPVLDGDVDLYCELRNTANVESDAFFEGTDSFDPVKMEAFMADQIAYITDAEAVAPTDLVEDLALQTAGLVELDALLAENDYDIVAVVAEIPAITETPEREAASDRLQAFADENCPEPLPLEPDDGADQAGDADDQDELPADGEFTEEDFAEAEAIITALEDPEQRAGFVEIIAEDGTVTIAQAECLLDNMDAQLLLEIDRVDFEGPDAATPGVLALFDLCEIDINVFTS